MKKISIRMIFSLFFLIATTLVFSAYMVHYYRTTKSEMIYELKNTAASMSELLSGSLRMPLWSMDKRTTEDIVASSMSRQVWAVIVTDEYNNVFFGMKRETDWRLVNTEESDFTGNFVTAEKEIVDKKLTLGKVCVYLTPRFMEEALLHAIKSMLFALLILNTLIFLLLYFFVQKVIIHPITTTVSCLSRLSVGDIPEIVAKRYIGEFNRIRESLNILVETTLETARISNEIAAGNMSVTVRERSENDRLMRALNRMIRRLNEIINETESMIKAVRAGELHIRGNTEAFQGGWRELVGGVNDLIDGLSIAISEKTALGTEMELAKKIQTALLPKKPEISGYEIAASCEPADEVGGDYYDVISLAGYDWIVIGDVSGHGLTSGLVMMMVQTAIHTVLIQNPRVPPSELLWIINRTIYENIVRMDEQKHMTILVIACGKDGGFDFSGLHEDILLWSSATKKVEKIETEGMWIGLEPDISKMLPVNKFRVGAGDCIVLYTDGIIEARHREEGGFFGEEYLIHILEKSGSKSAAEIHAEIIAALKDYKKSDDVTLFVMKRAAK